MNQEDSEEVFKRNYQELLDALDEETNESSDPLETSFIWNRHTRRRFDQALKKAKRKGLSAGTKMWKEFFKKQGFNL